jgi:hypothetical protein
MIRIVIITSLYLTSIVVFPIEAKIVNPIYEKISRNTVRIRIIKRSFDPDTGLPSIMLPPDKVFNEGIGFHIGKGHILVARHVINSVRGNDRSLFLDITTHTGKKIRKAKIGKCDPASELKSTDVCLLKTDFKGEGITLPRKDDLALLKDKIYGVLELDNQGVPTKKIRTGSFIDIKTMNKKENGQTNRGLELYKTSILTDGGYSGSPVFDIKTGKLLGMTTTKFRLGDKYKSGKVVIKKESAWVIPVKTIRRYLNSRNWKYTEIPRSWFY